MKKNQISFTCFLGVLLFCLPLISMYGQHPKCLTPDGITPPPASCTTLSAFIPKADDPIKTVRIAFHVMQREAPLLKGNFDENNQDHVDYLNGLVTRVNELYSYCNVQFCNCSYQNGLIQQRDTRIRFELTGIYYHRDNIGFINGNGTYDNSYCYNNYAVCKDEILNVFFCQIPDGTTGYGPNTHVMMLNFYSEYSGGSASTWGAGNTLGHEFGHVFGLFHSWFDKANYPDMCQSEGNAANFCSDPLTNCSCGNNVMSYSNIADYFSPLQMARMHITLLSLPVSKYLKSDNQNTPIVITQPTTWNSTRFCNSDVIIEPGATLTINCNVVMAKDTRIVTKRGARLIVNGSKITTKGQTVSTCNGTNNFERWGGIEVWGNTMTSTSVDMLNESYPLQLTDPGVVILKKGSIIENAGVGIFAQQRGTAWSVQQQHFGGLVSAREMEFRNCRKAAEFISDVPRENSSVFYDCVFNQTFLGTSLTNLTGANEGITFWQVNNVFVDLCKFNNLNRGVVLGNAFNTITRSTFDKTEYGVELSMTAPIIGQKGFVGPANAFKYCKWPVYAKSYGNLSVNDNFFEDCPTGVVLEGTSVFSILKNQFKNTNSIFPATFGFSTAIGLIQTGASSENEVRCNEYISVNGNSGSALIRDGIFAGGNNEGTYFNQNKFSCWYDVRVDNFADNSGLLYPGVLPAQGGFANPHTNDFTPFTWYEHKAEIFTPAPALNKVLKFRYYHPTGVCNVSQFIPRRPVSGTCNVLQNPFNFENTSTSWDSDLGCLPGSGGGGIASPDDCRDRKCLDDLYTQIQQKDNLLLPGDAPALFNSISSAAGSSATLTALNAASPYLSEDILEAVLQSSMSENQKRNVLAANLPLSAFIKNKAAQNLSTVNYQYLLAQEQPNMVSLRDNAREERITLNNRKMKILRFLTDSLVGIGNVPAADALLTADPESYSREARVGLKLQTGDTNGALQLLNVYPSVAQSDIDFKFVQQLNLQRMTSAGLPSSADSLHLFELAMSRSPQSGYAKSLAGILYGAVFAPSIPPPTDEETDDREDVLTPENKQKIATVTPSFEIYPNPAEAQITIDLSIKKSETETHEVVVFDLNGKQILRRQLTQQTTVLDIAVLEPGFYTISWIQEGKLLSTRYFVKK